MVRLSVTTEFLTDIDWSAEEAIDVVRHLGLMAPCYSVRHLSNEVAERLGADDEAGRSVSLVSTIHMREQAMAWLPKLFARPAVVTICDAHHRAAKAAELTQATASRSAPGGGDIRSQPTFWKGVTTSVACKSCWVMPMYTRVLNRDGKCVRSPLDAI